MPIYPMLNQWNANPMTPNPGLWLVESVMNIDENPFRMPIYPMLKLWILMSWIFCSTSSHTLCVLGQATPSDLNVVNPLSYWPLSSDQISTNPVARWRMLLRPSRGGAWYTCPVTIVGSSLDVYKPWWDRAGESVVWGQIGASPDISDMSQHAQTTVLWLLWSR